jgi:hypothetical protein
MQINNLRKQTVIANVDRIWICDELNSAHTTKDKEILEFAGCEFRKATVKDVDFVIERCCPVGELHAILAQLE